MIQHTGECEELAALAQPGAMHIGWQSPALIVTLVLVFNGKNARATYVK